jgi:hypothetical protein
MSKKRVKFTLADSLTRQQYKDVMKGFNNQIFDLAIFRAYKLGDEEGWPTILDIQQPNYVASRTDNYDGEARIYQIHNKRELPEF